MTITAASNQSPFNRRSLDPALASTDPRAPLGLKLRGSWCGAPVSAMMPYALSGHADSPRLAGPERLGAGVLLPIHRRTVPPPRSSAWTCRSLILRRGEESPLPEPAGQACEGSRHPPEPGNRFGHLRLRGVLLDGLLAADPDVAPPAERVYAPLRDIVARANDDGGAPIDLAAIADVSAPAVAGKLADVLDRISVH